MARRSTEQQYAIYALVLALLIFFGIIVLFSPSNWFLVWLIVWSVTAFLLYGYDKTQSKRNAWRVPERVLLGLALIGGAAGSLLGMALFRHKIRKTIFWAAGGVGLVVQLYLLFRLS